MTSQLIILNRYGAAVASDSLATITSPDEGILGSVNMEKVFALANPHKILILNNDSGEISGAPLGLLFSLWQKQLPAEALPTVWDYLENFIDFLQDSQPEIYPDSNSEFRKFIWDLFGPISEEMAQDFPEFRPFSDETKIKFAEDSKFASQYRIALSRKINKFLRELESMQPQRFRDLEDDPNQEERLQKQVCSDRGIDAMIDAWFPDEIIAKATKNNLRDKIHLALNRVPVSRDASLCRLTFVGYGSKEPYPRVWDLGIDSKFDSVVRWRGLGSANLESSRSEIYFMAQTSTIKNFLYGVHPDFLNDLRENVPKAVTEDAFENYDNPDEFDLVLEETWKGIGSNVYSKLELHMQAFQSQKLTDFKTKLDFMDARELASVADSLVRIEILAAENRSGPMTVGGKIKVATVNHQDGVSWINPLSA